MHPTTLAPMAAATPKAGLLRVALAVAVALLVYQAWTPAEAGWAYVAAGLAVAFGVLSVAGRPQTLMRDRLVRVVLDSAFVGLLVAYTGGGGSPFFFLFFLAALGITSIEARPRVVAATLVVVGGYLAAAVFAAGALGPGTIVKAGFLVLFCAVVGFLGHGMQGLKKLALGLSSTLANEIDRVEKDEALISKFGPVLKVLRLEETLRWAAEAAHTVGGSYAHVATLDGNHATVLQGDFGACPSWWHPSIQRLLLWSCREGETVRSEEEILGIEGFMAVPIGPEQGEKRGAIIVGGKEFRAEEERALKLLAGGIAPALENAEDSPGGLDQLTGLPNRASLYRFLWRELSQGRTLAVLLVDLDRFGEYNLTYGRVAGDALLRRIGGKLREGRQRAFRYGDDEFAVVLLGGSGEARARRVAAGVRQVVAEQGGCRATSAAVGFALAEGGVHTDPGAVLGTALRALDRAKGRDDGVMGLTVGESLAQDGPVVGSIEGFVESLVGALEAKDPDIERHLRAVSRLSLLIGHRLSLPREQVQALVVGGLLHDVGKIGVPDTVLHKPGRLTVEEYEVMKRHPVLGAEIVSPVKELALALPAINHHHERFDGRGYPDGLRGEEIPLLARVVAVADAFDSMIRDRPYGYGISQEAALKEVEDNAGTQFDPRIVKTLREVLEDTGDRRAGSTG